MVGNQTRLTGWFLAGMGFYWSWILSGPLWATLTEASSAFQPASYLVISTVAHLMALLVALCLARQAESLVARKGFVLGASLLVAMATLSMGLGRATVWAVPLSVVGNVLGGIGSAGLILSWATLASHVEADLTKVAVTCSVPFALVVFLASLAIEPVLATLVVACFPVLSGCCCLKSLALSQGIEPADASAGKMRSWRMRDSLWLFAYCLVFDLPFGFFRGYYHGSSSLFSTAALCALVVIVGFIFFDNRSREGAGRSVAFKTILPLCTGGVIMLIFLTPTGTDLPGVLLFASNTLFIMYIYAELFLLCSLTTENPVRIMAMGDICQSAGLILGVLIGIAAGRLSGTWYVGFLAALAYALFLFAYMKTTRGPVGAKEAKDADGEVPEIIFLESQGLHFSAEAGEGAAAASSDMVGAIEGRCKEVACARGLSGREEEVLVLLARGRSVPLISQELYLSQNTIKTYISRVYAKLDVHSRAELIALVERSAVAELR